MKSSSASRPSLAVARDADCELRGIARFLRQALGHLVDQCRTHPLGMVDVLAEDDGLAVGVGLRHIRDHLLGDAPSALVQDQHPVHVALIVDAVFNLLAAVVSHALRRPPTLQVLVEIKAHDLKRREKTVVNALLEAIDVDGIAKITERTDLGGLLRRRRKARVGWPAQSNRESPATHWPRGHCPGGTRQ